MFSFLRAVFDVLVRPDFRKIKQELAEGRCRYRIVRGRSGWEPQTLTITEVARRAYWQPLTARGYWTTHVDAAHGMLFRRSFLPTRDDAARAIERAKAIHANQSFIALA